MMTKLIDIAHQTEPRKLHNGYKLTFPGPSANSARRRCTPVERIRVADRPRMLSVLPANAILKSNRELTLRTECAPLL